MNKRDLKNFSKVWGPAQETYGKDPSDAVVMMAFSLLEKYSLDEIKKALTLHMTDSDVGEFAPKPANVIKQIEKINHDGRLSADEAWAVALNSFDESTTVIMCDEIASALQVSRDIYQDGDRTGARMAFRSAYERRVEYARERGVPLRWWPSLGHDQSGREQVIQEGIDQGRLGSGARDLIGLPYSPGNPLLAEAAKALK